MGKSVQPPVLDQILGKKWNSLRNNSTLRRNNDDRLTASSNRRYSIDTTRPQRKRATQEYLEKRSGERNVDSRIPTFVTH